VCAPYPKTAAKKDSFQNIDVFFFAKLAKPMSSNTLKIDVVDNFTTTRELNVEGCLHHRNQLSQLRGVEIRVDERYVGEFGFSDCNIQGLP
jgi:hypothetical protein